MHQSLENKIFWALIANTKQAAMMLAKKVQY